MAKDSWLRISVVVLAILCVGLGFLCQWNWDNKYLDRGVPRIEIDLNGVSLDEIKGGSKEVKYEGNGIKVYNGGEILKYEGVEVKGRGNGTWAKKKKPYRIKFERKVDLFGMGKTRKWVLLANTLDATNLRNEVGLSVARMLGMEYALEGRYVELYVDGKYEGLYYLTHAVEVDKRVVDLRNPLGVLMELDNLYWIDEEYYETGNGDKLVVKDVVVDDMAEVATREFLQDYNEFELAVAEKDFVRVSELVDVRSFAQYYLLSEFTVNPDAYWTSFYMYKDGDDDKIHAGPGWDFNLALANRNWGNWMGERFYSPTETMVRRDELMDEKEYEELGLTGGEINWYEQSQRISRIIYDLMELPEFRAEVETVYRERMAGRCGELVTRLRAKAAEIITAVRADEERWGGEGFSEEVERLAEWLWTRCEFFEEEYGGESYTVE